MEKQKLNTNVDEDVGFPKNYHFCKVSELCIFPLKLTNLPYSITDVLESDLIGITMS